MEISKSGQFESRRGHKESSYADNFALVERLFPEAIAALEKHLHGGTVVDIGGGRSDWIRQFAEKAGAKRCINIDVVPRTNIPTSKITEYVTADAIEYLSKPEVLRSVEGSCNFAVNGIDATISGIDSEELVSIMMFYLKKGDYVFGIHAPEVAKALSEEKYFKPLFYNTNKHLFYAFRYE